MQFLCGMIAVPRRRVSKESPFEAETTPSSPAQTAGSSDQRHYQEDPYPDQVRFFLDAIEAMDSIL
jgi:hypothetical protein